MRFFVGLVLATVGVSLGLGGCSSSKNDGAGGGSGSGGGSAFENNGPGTCAGTTRPKNDDFCNGKCLGSPTCVSSKSRPIDSCCVQVGQPGQSSSSPYLVRTTDTKEYADPNGGPPNLGCFDPAGYPAKPPAAGSKKATLTGELKPFANGGCNQTDLVGVTIEVYSVKRTGDPTTDGALDQLIGTPVVIADTDPTVEECVSSCSAAGSTSCPNNQGTRYNRQFQYKDLPMYQELAIKTYGTGWTPLYTYNVYIGDNDPDYDATKGTYTYHVRALASDDFATIPTVAIGKTITPGNGAIGGEVHDCDNVRLQNARVDLSLPRLALEYFDSNEDNPLPDSSRREIGTGRTALYTGLDIQVSGAQGSFERVAGTGLIQDGTSSKLVSLGYFDVRIFPDSVTSVSLRGLRPFQVP